MMLERLNGRQQSEDHPDTDLIAENDVVEISIGIDKIEPLYIKINFADMFGNDKPIADKLNEVIENQNKIIDYLNGMVKK